MCELEIALIEFKLSLCDLRQCVHVFIANAANEQREKAGDFFESGDQRQATSFGFIMRPNVRAQARASSHIVCSDLLG